MGSIGMYVLVGILFLFVLWILNLIENKSSEKTEYDDTDDFVEANKDFLKKWGDV